VLVKVLRRPDSVTPSGIVGLVDKWSHEGIVVAVGPGKANKRGVVKPLDVQPGERVVFEKNHRGHVVDGIGDPRSMYVLMPESDILTVIQVEAAA